MSRKATIERKTKETEISLSLDLDGYGRSQIATGHRLPRPHADGARDPRPLRPGGRDARATCTWTRTTRSRTSGIVLGQALSQALGDKQGIVRFGHAYVPLDEALSRCVIDLSGRPFLHFDVTFKARQVGNDADGAVRGLLLGARGPRRA